MRKSKHCECNLNDAKIDTVNRVENQSFVVSVCNLIYSILKLKQKLWFDKFEIKSIRQNEDN